MAHKLIGDIPEQIKKTKFKLPNIQGKFGFSLFVGEKELFIGVSVSEVVLEHIIKRRFIKAPDTTVKVMQVD